MLIKPGYNRRMIPEFLIIGTVLFATMAWNANQPWSMALFSACSFLTLAVTLINQFRQGKTQFRFSWIFLPLSCFLALVLIQYLHPVPDLDAPAGLLPYTVEPHTTRLYLLFASGCCALLFCIVNGFNSRRQILQLIIVVLAIGVFEAIYGLVQSLGGFNNIWGMPVRDSYAHGTIPNRNHFALLLNIAVSLCVGLFYARSKKLLPRRKRSIREILITPKIYQLVLIMLLSGIMSLGVLSSGSRMGVFALFAALVFMIAAILFIESKQYALILALSLALVIIGLGYESFHIVTERFERLDAPGELENSRLSIWQDSWLMIRNTLWFGQGLGSFQWTFRAYETVLPDTPAVYAHNDYLQVLAETGIIGLLCLLAAFAASLKAAIQNILSRDHLVRGAGLAAIGALAAAALQEITDYALYFPGTAVFLVLLIGLNERVRWLPCHDSFKHHPEKKRRILLV